MFDYVRYEAPCKKCGKILTNWQSKDGECLLNHLEPREVERFYALCMDSSCWTWNRRIVVSEEIKVDTYEPEP